MNKLLKDTECDYQSTIVDLRRATDQQFTEAWLPMVLDTITFDIDCGPAQIAMLLCVVRDRYASMAGQPPKQDRPRTDYDTCDCGSPKLKTSNRCKSCACKSAAKARYSKNRG